MQLAKKTAALSNFGELQIELKMELNTILVVRLFRDEMALEPSPKFGEQ